MGEALELDIEVLPHRVTPQGEVAASGLPEEPVLLDTGCTRVVH